MKKSGTHVGILRGNPLPIWKELVSLVPPRSLRSGPAHQVRDALKLACWWKEHSPMNRGCDGVVLTLSVAPVSQLVRVESSFNGASRAKLESASTTNAVIHVNKQVHL